MELKFKNGNVTIDKHIPYVNENLGKIRLVSGGSTEGVWVALSEEDKKKYNNDDLYDEHIVGVICNASMSGIPWGAYVKVTLSGINRPMCECSDIFEEGQKFQYADWAADSICDNLAKSLASGELKLEEPASRAYLIDILTYASDNDVTAALKSLLEQ